MSFEFFRHPQYFLLSFGGIHVCIQVIVGPCFGDSYVLFCFLLCCLYAALFSSLLSLSRVLLASFFVWMLSCTSPSTTRSSFPASYFQMFSLAISRLAVSDPQSLSPSPVSFTDSLLYHLSCLFCKLIPEVWFC